MVYVYLGKLDWFQYAVNETYVLVLPGDIAVGQPVYHYFQWTKDAQGNVKKNNAMQSVINSVSKTDNGSLKFGFTWSGYYRFEAVVSTDAGSIELTMYNPSGDASKPNALKQSYRSNTREQLAIYTGKMNWLSYAKDEIVVVIVPDGLRMGQPVCHYNQWTKDASGNEKSIQEIVTYFKKADVSTAGDTKVQYENYYTWDATVSVGKDTLSMRMSKSTGDNSSFELKRHI